MEPLQVSETDDAVTIAAFTRYMSPTNGGCDDPLFWVPMDVHLNQPLGDRRLEGCDGSPYSFIDPLSPGLDCRSTLQ